MLHKEHVFIISNHFKSILDEANIILGAPFSIVGEQTLGLPGALLDLAPQSLQNHAVLGIRSWAANGLQP